MKRCKYYTILWIHDNSCDLGIIYHDPLPCPLHPFGRNYNNPIQVGLLRPRPFKKEGWGHPTRKKTMNSWAACWRQREFRMSGRRLLQIPATTTWPVIEMGTTIIMSISPDLVKNEFENKYTCKYNIDTDTDIKSLFLPIRIRLSYKMYWLYVIGFKYC